MQTVHSLELNPPVPRDLGKLGQPLMADSQLPKSGPIDHQSRKQRARLQPFRIAEHQERVGCFGCAWLPHFHRAELGQQQPAKRTPNGNGGDHLAAKSLWLIAKAANAPAIPGWLPDCVRSHGQAGSR